ncbi:MAG: hypothetical protein AABY10_02685, partial [Nanoarchaeota archaeon]
DVITRNAHKVWHNPRKSWIFDPQKVAEQKETEIETILRQDFQFNLQGNGEENPAKRFSFNAKHLVDNYQGDPRKLIEHKNIDQARARLMEFKGIGTGIANLFIIYMIDRKLASPIDPENAFLKVDIHKGRIPINCEAVTPTNAEIYRDESYVRTLERAYREICKKNKLDPHILDAVLWVIGSKGCARNDYSHCQMECPLFENCAGNTPEDKETGRYLVEINGVKTDSRRRQGQL